MSPVFRIPGPAREWRLSRFQVLQLLPILGSFRLFMVVLVVLVVLVVPALSPSMTPLWRTLVQPEARLLPVQYRRPF